MWKGKPIGDGTPFEAERAFKKPCEFNSRSFRLVNDECAIGRAAKVLDFQSGQVGSTPTWHSVLRTALGCRVTVNQLPLKQWYEGSTPSARAEQTNEYSGVATVGRCVWL